MKFTSLNIKLGGAAGEGIKSVGLTLSKCFTRSGYYTFDYSEYPSLIRGGHNTYQSYISTSPTNSQIKNVDILIALNQDTVNFHQDELKPESVIIYDPQKVKLETKEKLVGNYLAIDLNKLAIDAGGTPLMANIVALGAVMYLTGLDVKVLKEIISQIFKSKGDKIIIPNQKAAELGFEFAKKNSGNHQMPLEKAANNNPKYLISGNEAIALGAICSGLKFYAAYPMTPTTGILHYLAQNAKECGLVVKHSDDEISAANMIVAASYAGVRSMTGTSGGGFCLMVEALGMAGIMELPTVFVNGMRSGPSSGMPTWHDQGDLLFAVNASHGEFPKMVLTPGDIKESFDWTREAFYFAEKYQLPVIILTDKYIAESAQVVENIEKSYKNLRYGLTENTQKNYLRYKDSKDGISLRSVPGQAGLNYLANSYEHDEYGFATEEIETRNKMVIKRNKKLEALAIEISKLKFEIHGDPEAEIGVISWGSNKGPILAALKLLGNKKVAFLNLPVVWPFPVTQVKEFVKNKKTLVDIECNSTSQLSSVMRQATGIEVNEKLCRFDGRPFYPEDIAEFLNNVILDRLKAGSGNHTDNL